MRDASGEQAIDIPGVRVVRSYDSVMMVGWQRVSADAGQVQPVAVPGYELRVWRPGDRMKPARLKGRSRKLSDLFIDAKVPRELRRTARVLVRARDHVIVWAEHVGVAFGESEAGLPLPDRIAGDF